MSARPCQDIAGLSFLDYRGLPSDCSLARLLDRFPAVATRPGAGTLGRARDPAGFWTARAEIARGPLLFWFRGEDAVRIDIEFPNDFDWAGQSESWGEPGAREDYHLGGVVLRASALVWASRGITIFTNEERSRATRVMLYRACSLDDYREHVFWSEPDRERPFEDPGGS